MISTEEFEFVVALAAELVPTVPQHFRDKWGLDADLAQAKAILEREQTREATV